MNGQVEVDEITEAVAQIRLLSRVIVEMDVDQDDRGTISMMMHQAAERLGASNQSLERILFDSHKKRASVETETPVVVKVG